MKKLLAAFLAVVMTFAVCACDSDIQTESESKSEQNQNAGIYTLAGKSVKEIYYSAVDYVKSLVNYEITIDALYRSSYLGETDATSETVTQTVSEDTAKTVYRASGDTYSYKYVIGDNAYEEHFIYDGTTLYQAMNGVREQKNMTYDEFLEGYGNIVESGMLLELNDSSFLNVAFIPTDGKYVLEFTVSPEEYYDLVGGEIETPIVYTVYFDASGTILSFDRVMEYYDSDTVYVEDYMTVTISNVGTVLPISAPENASEYAIRPSADQIDKTKVESLEGFEISDQLTDYVLIKFKITAPKTESADGAESESATESATESDTETANESTAESATDESESTTEENTATDLDGYEGEILIRLYPEVAPETVANFKKLIGSAHYKGLEINNIIEGFALQIGEHLTAEDFTGDTTEEEDDKNALDYVFGEFAYNGFTNNLSHTSGVISMLRGEDPNSATDECFICMEDATELDGYYASFGYVVYGFDDILKKVVGLETDNYGIPTSTVTIVSTDFVTKKA